MNNKYDSLFQDFQKWEFIKENKNATKKAIKKKRKKTRELDRESDHEKKNFLFFFFTYISYIKVLGSKINIISFEKILYIVKR